MAMFEEILGQEKAKTIVTNLIKSERFPHSLLFYGPQGVGKFLFAKSIARYFNCQNPDEKQKAMDKCITCSQIDNEVYPDLFVVRTETTVLKTGKEKESKEIKKEQIKEIIKYMHYKPFKGTNKFFIIDGAETMNNISENAFLKTLEEPLPDNYIILISHNINKILPTILSRCIKIKFDSLREDILKGIIKKQYDLDSKLADKISLLSNGSVFNSGLLIENDMHNTVFKILDDILKNINETFVNVDELIVLGETVNKLEIKYINYLLDFLLVYLNESYLRSFYNIRRLEIFKYCLNFKTNNIKLNAYNNIVNDIIESKYYLLNTNVDKRLLFENLIIKIKENLL